MTSRRRKNDHFRRVCRRSERTARIMKRIFLPSIIDALYAESPLLAVIR